MKLIEKRNLKFILCSSYGEKKLSESKKLGNSIVIKIDYSERKKIENI